MRPLGWNIAKRGATTVVGVLSLCLTQPARAATPAANAGDVPAAAHPPLAASPSHDTAAPSSASDAAAQPAVASEVDDRLRQALALLKQRSYEAARTALLQAHARLAAHDPRLHDTLLLLGICAYRLGQLEQAELELQQAAASSDPETQGQARIFLSQVYAEQGASDQARRELGNAAGSVALRESADRLLRQSRPHRLHLSLLLSPEFDGNVPLAPLYVDGPSFPAWQRDPRASMDGDVLFLASLGVRPLRAGLLVGNTFSYRQQVQLGDYNLLLNSTWLSFSHLTAKHRLRLAGALSFAMLGSSFLYVDGMARVQYRRRLRSQWGLSGTYEARYRDYHTADFAGLTGLSQTLQLELGWGLAPQPVSFGIGYQGLREQTQTPSAEQTQDFRAWVHGPLLWLRARLHSRVELALTSTLLQRLFDRGRVDYAVYQDLNLNVAMLPWLSAFVGGSTLYNSSSDPFFQYIKPSVSVGLLMYLGLL